MSDGLAKGTLLLDATAENSPKVWTVVSPRKVVAAVDGIVMEASLTMTPTATNLPEGWHLIDNRQLARHLANTYKDRVLVSSQCGHRQEAPTMIEIEGSPQILVRKCATCGTELFWQQNEWRLISK